MHPSQYLDCNFERHLFVESFPVSYIIRHSLLVISYQHLAELLNAVIVKTDVIAFDGIAVILARPL